MDFEFGPWLRASGLPSHHKVTGRNNFKRDGSASHDGGRGNAVNRFTTHNQSDGD